MKTSSVIVLGVISSSLISCSSLKNLSEPLEGDSGFDPLSSPGTSSSRSARVTQTAPKFQPGQWVETSMANATFFRSFPRGNAQPSKVLTAGVPLKVISNRGTYVKVELDSGDVGFIPQIMVGEKPTVVQPRSVRTPAYVPPPLPEVGTVPPPIDPIDTSGDSLAPPPSVPGIPPVVPVVPSVPTVPSLPVPVTPPIPAVPEVPASDSGLAPPPEIPGL